MEQRTLGSLQVSVVGLGCNNFGSRLDAGRTAAVVSAALDSGINFFDTADVYGGTRSEEYLGKALGGRREQVVIATKFGMEIDAERRGASPDYVRRAAEASLRRLGTDYIDLYQLHEPDRATPIGDTLTALQSLVSEGKVREIGCSNFSADQLREAVEAAGSGPRFVSVQNEYNLLNREPEDDVLLECRTQGIGFIPYFPLASGLLTGKYRPGSAPPPGSRLSGGENRWLTADNLETAESLREWAESRGHTLLDLAVSWLAARPMVVSVIAGATRPEQVRDNARAGQWQLSPAEMDQVDAVLEGVAGTG